jgi:hypothetical protein
VLRGILGVDMASIAGEGLADGRQGASLAVVAQAALRQALASVRDPSVLFVFASEGDPGRAGTDGALVAAREARRLAPDAVVVAAEAPGVLSMGTERERQRATAVLCFDRAVARAALTSVPLDLARRRHEQVLREGAARLPDGSSCAVGVVALLAAASHTSEALTGLARHEGAPLAGAGAFAVVAALPGSAPEPCAAAVVSLAGSLQMSTIVSPAVRSLTPWMRVTAQEGTFLLTLDDRPALDVVGGIVREEGRREPLLVLVRGIDDEPPLVRSIAGVDPSRAAVAIADLLPAGVHVAFGVRDAGVGRGDLARRLSSMTRSGGGAVPAAALMFTCVARGRALFGAGDVDARTLRAKVAVPAAGMQSAFELAPWGGVTRAHLYTAVAAIFHRPS